MKTVYLLRYSQLTQPNMLESVKAFVKHIGITGTMNAVFSKLIQAAHKQGGSPLSEYSPEEMEQVSQGAIYLFKIGKINETEFVTKMNQAMGINLSMETFKECWNAMCTLQPKTLEFLRQVEKLQQENGFGIHVMGNTNSMQANYIHEQFAAAGLQLDMGHTFSFEAGMLNPEPPRTTDAGWVDINIVDLRDNPDILTEFKKRTLESSSEHTPSTYVPLHRQASHYLPSFNRRTAIAALGTLVIAGAAMYLRSDENQSARPSVGL